ncbi:MAG: UbiA prenyltransferase family protein [Isosphaeraceae bacterium]
MNPAPSDVEPAERPFPLTDSTVTTLQRLRGLVKSARLWQWTKNLACLAGLIFSGRLLEGSAIAEAALAVLGFCLASSAIYLLNDLCDRPLDRRNLLKRHRPIASGLVPTSWALVGALGLLIAALGSSLALPLTCTSVLIAYIALSVAYSLRLKHTVLLDVLCIALGFVLRVLYGVYAVQATPTPWIVLCMFFLALFLGFAKRRGELNLGDVNNDVQAQRPVLLKYHLNLLDLLLGMTATMAILTYTIYTVTGHQGNATLVVTVPLVVYGIIRYLLLVVVHGHGGAPDRQLVVDRVNLAIVALWVGLCIVIIYFKVHIFEN